MWQQPNARVSIRAIRALVRRNRLRLSASSRRRTLDKNARIQAPVKVKKSNGRNHWILVYLPRARRARCVSMGILNCRSHIGRWLYSRSITIASAPLVISLAKMTMRSDVWHLCITQDEFGVRVSALATKIKDSWQIGKRIKRKRKRAIQVCVRGARSW